MPSFPAKMENCGRDLVNKLVSDVIQKRERSCLWYDAMVKEYPTKQYNPSFMFQRLFFIFVYLSFTRTTGWFSSDYPRIGQHMSISTKSNVPMGESGFTVRKNFKFAEYLAQRLGLFSSHDSVVCMNWSSVVLAHRSIPLSPREGLQTLEKYIKSIIHRHNEIFLPNGVGADELVPHGGQKGTAMTDYKIYSSL